MQPRVALARAIVVSLSNTIVAISKGKIGQIGLPKSVLVKLILLRLFILAKKTLKLKIKYIVTH